MQKQWIIQSMLLISCLVPFHSRWCDTNLFSCALISLCVRPQEVLVPEAFRQPHTNNGVCLWRLAHTEGNRKKSLKACQKIAAYSISWVNLPPRAEYRRASHWVHMSAPSERFSLSGWRAVATALSRPSSCARGPFHQACLTISLSAVYRSFQIFTAANQSAG